MAMHYILILFLLFLSSFGKPDDQLTHTKPLTHRDMLVSKRGDFALGFFSPVSSNKSFYLGIWYHGLPGPQTFVWVANRDNPITNPSSAMLTISNNSSMVLSDSEGRNIWMTSTNITAGAYAVLLNSGNFVLRSLDDIDIWQSFDHPTDTILPSMKVLVDYRGHAVGRLVAWKSPDDPSFGDFSFGGDSSSAGIQLVTWNKTKIYCRIKVWSGLSVSGGTYLGNGSSILYQTDVYSGDEFYSMFTVSDKSPLMRITLDYTGKLKSLTWDNHSSSWALMDERPATACELYASCGPFSYCDSTQIIPACQCLEGFEPIDSINFSRGCQRKQELKCGEQSRFVPMPGMMVPDKFLRIHNTSFDECVAECNRNCSCMAYAYANLSRAGVMADSSRCFVWSGELTDIGKISTGEDLYI